MKSLVTQKTQPATSAIGVKLNAATSDTLRFLGEQAGRQIEATVISATANPSSSNKQANSATEYLVQLKVGNQQLQVTAAKMPRVGQKLLLEVVDYQTLRILNAATSNRADSTLTASRVDAKNQITPNPTIPASEARSQNPQMAVIQQALKLALPRQLNGQELKLTLQQLLGQPAPSAQKAANTSAPSTNNLASPAITTTGDRNAVNIPVIPSQIANTRVETAPSGISQQNAKAQSSTLNTATTSSTSGSSPNDSDILRSLSNLRGERLPPILSARLDAYKGAVNSLAELRNPATLETALQNSGLFYEKKLLAIAQQHQPLLKSLARLHAKNNALNDNTSNNLTKPQAGADKSLNTVIADNLKQDIDRQLRGDLKYQLLSLTASAKQLLAGNSRNPSPSVTTGNAQLTEHLLPDASLHRLFDALNNHTTNIQSANTSNNKSFDTISQLLRLVLGGLNRTQVHQLQSAGSQLAAGSEQSTTQSLNAEVPFLHQGRVSVLDIALERETAKKATSATPNTWNVRLRFDLDELGELSALCTLQHKTIAAVFWASADALADKIKAELPSFNNNLTALGLHVSHLHCQLGAPDSEQLERPVNLFNSHLLDELT